MAKKDLMFKTACLLRDKPDGISAVDIAKVVGVKPDNIWRCVYNLRRKKGFDIKTTSDDLYIWRNPGNPGVKLGISAPRRSLRGHHKKILSTLKRSESGLFLNEVVDLVGVQSGTAHTYIGDIRRAGHRIDVVHGRHIYKDIPGPSMITDEKGTREIKTVTYHTRTAKKVPYTPKPKLQPSSNNNGHGKAFVIDEDFIRKTSKILSPEMRGKLSEVVRNAGEFNKILITIDQSGLL